MKIEETIREKILTFNMINIPLMYITNEKGNLQH